LNVGANIASIQGDKELERIFIMRGSELKLFQACKVGNIDIVEQIIYKLKWRGKYNLESYILTAIVNRHDDIAKLLLDKNPVSKIIKCCLFCSGQKISIIRSLCWCSMNVERDCSCNTCLYGIIDALKIFIAVGNLFYRYRRVYICENRGDDISWYLYSKCKILIENVLGDDVVPFFQWDP